VDWVCGYEVVTFLAPKWTPSMRWFGGFPLGFAYHALLALIVQFYVPWGWTNYGIVVGLLVFLAAFCRRMRQGVVQMIEDVHPLAAVALICFVTFAVFRLHKIYFEHGVSTRGVDMSDHGFHHQLASSFVVGCNMKRRSWFGFCFGDRRQSHLSLSGAS
jgi:hypothetical protein